MENRLFDDPVPDVIDRLRRQGYASFVPDAPIPGECPGGETKGLVLSDHGALPYAWFHAHSGGMTALADQGRIAQEIVTYYFRNVEVVKMW